MTSDKLATEGGNVNVTIILNTIDRHTFLSPTIKKKCTYNDYNNR